MLGAKVHEKDVALALAVPGRHGKVLVRKESKWEGVLAGHLFFWGGGLVQRSTKKGKTLLGRLLHFFLHTPKKDLLSPSQNRGLLCRTPFDFGCQLGGAALSLSARAGPTAQLQPQKWPRLRPEHRTLLHNPPPHTACPAPVATPTALRQSGVCPPLPATRVAGSPRAPRRPGARVETWPPRPSGPPGEATSARTNFVGPVLQRLGGRGPPRPWTKGCGPLLVRPTKRCSLRRLLEGGPMPASSPSTSPWVHCIWRRESCSDMNGSVSSMPTLNRAYKKDGSDPVSHHLADTKVEAPVTLSTKCTKEPCLGETTVRSHCHMWQRLNDQPACLIRTL